MPSAAEIQAYLSANPGMSDVYRDTTASNVLKVKV